MSSSLLNFGMFNRSTTLKSRISHLIFKAGGFGSWDNIYFGLPYLSLRINGSFSTAARLLILSWGLSCSLTKLQNYSLCESKTRSFKAPKNG